MLKSVLPMFSSKSFIVSGLTFRSLNYFDFIFVCVLQCLISFFFFTCNCPVFPAPCIEETIFSPLYLIYSCFPGSSDGKNSACNAGDPGLIPGSGRSPGEGNGNPLQYYCLENLMGSGAWWATVHGVAKSQTRLSD